MLKKLSNQISIDDRLVEFTEGETLYQIAQRCPTNDPCSHPIPTLCYDDRLDPVGSCRLCVVESMVFETQLLPAQQKPHQVW